MAGDSENNIDRFNSLLFGVDSNARRFKTNFDSIYEKYHRPFVDDDILDLNNLTIKKDNGLLQRKKSVLFGEAKLKCSRNKGARLKVQVLESTFTIDRNVSMAIKRECDSFLVGAELDDDEGAETLSSLSSEDEEEDNDVYEGTDNSDSGNSKNEPSSDCIELGSDGSLNSEDSSDESHTENSSSGETDKQLRDGGNGFGFKNGPQKSRGPGQKQNLTNTRNGQLNATFDINAGLKAEKILSKDRNQCHQRTCKSINYQREHKESRLSTAKHVGSKVDNSKGLKPPMRVESFPLKGLAFSQSNRASTKDSSTGSPLRNSFNTTSSCTSNTSITGSLKDLKLVSISSPLKCESLNSSGNSSSASPASKSIASSFGDLTLKSSPKVARNNSTIDKILGSPSSRQSSPKSIKNSQKNEMFSSNAFPSKKAEVIFKSPSAAVKRRIIPTKVDSMEKRQIVPSNLFPQNAAKCNGHAYKKNIANVQELDSHDETLQSSCSKSNCKMSCFANVSDSLLPAMQKPKSVDKKLWSKHLSPIESNSYRPKIMYPNANSTEISIFSEPLSSVHSLCNHQHVESSEFTSSCNSCRLASPAVLPRTNDASLKEISSIGRHIDSNTFCVDVSFSSTEDDLKAGIKNYDFIFQELPAKQKEAACHTKASACEKEPASDRRKPFLSEKNCPPQLEKKLSCRCVQTVDVSVLSRSTQTANGSESTHNFPESEKSKITCYPGLAGCHFERSNLLGQHGFDESKWKTEENSKKTISNQHRGFKRKDFSTSDYFTDSSSPRKLISNVSEQCSCSSNSKSTETNNLKSYNQSTRSVGHPPCHYHTASALSPVRSYAQHESAQQSLDLLSQIHKDFDTESLLKRPIIVDRNKLRKRLALKKKSTICHEETLLNSSSDHNSILESTGVDNYAYSIATNTNDDTLTEASVIALENDSEKHAFKKLYQRGCGFEFSTKGKNSETYFKDVSIQTNNCLDCQTFIVFKRENVRSPFFSSGSPKRPSNTFYGESDVTANKSEPRSCCCQRSHTKQDSPRSPMFPNWYINKFCPKNPSRVDSDASEHAPDEPSLSLESFKEGLKAFRPNRNIMKPPDKPMHSGRSSQGPFLVPDIEFHQKPSKLRKISSSKLSLKKPTCPSRKDCISKEEPPKLSHLPNTRAFFPIRASTPFCGMSSSESSFSDTTLSTIAEPPSYKEVERELDQTISSNLSDEIDLLH